MHANKSFVTGVDPQDFWSPPEFKVLENTPDDDVDVDEQSCVACRCFCGSATRRALSTRSSTRCSTASSKARFCDCCAATGVATMTPRSGSVDCSSWLVRIRTSSTAVPCSPGDHVLVSLHPLLYSITIPTDWIIFSFMQLRKHVSVSYVTYSILLCTSRDRKHNCAKISHICGSVCIYA